MSHLLFIWGLSLSGFSSLCQLMVFQQIYMRKKQSTNLLTNSIWLLIWLDVLELYLLNFVRPYGLFYFKFSSFYFVFAALLMDKNLPCWNQIKFCKKCWDRMNICHWRLDAKFGFEKIHESLWIHYRFLIINFQFHLFFCQINI